MPLRRILQGLLSALCLLAAISFSRQAVALDTISLRSTRSALLADGKQTTVIRAEVRDSSGRSVGNNVQVQFTTTLGTLSQTQAITIAGTAQTTLTSGVEQGACHVTASVVVGGQALAALDIEFTNDPEATFEGNNYMAFASMSYLAYSATDRVVEADGRNGGARMTYHNVELTADRIQVRCDDLIIRAHDNVTFRRGNHVLHATRLYYSLQSEQGYALALDAAGKLGPVTVKGANMLLAPMPMPIPYSYVTLPDLQVKLLVVAKGISYFPGEKLQFRRARFFQDQVQILSLPFYELPLHTTELFSDQFISVGTSGLGLDLPYYFDLSARGSLIGYLHHEQQLGRGYYATDPGWGVDLIKSYSEQGSQRYEGAYGFTDLLGSDWTFRWTHSQEFDHGIQGTMFVDFPSHEGVFTAASYSEQFKTFHIGANFSGGQTWIGPITESNQTNLYAETNPHRLMGINDVSYVLASTLMSTRTTSQDSTIGSFEDTQEGLDIRATVKPRRLDAHTTFNESFTVGQTWSATQQSGFTSLATLSLDRTLVGGGSVNIAYDFIDQPAAINILEPTGKNRISASLNYAGVKRFSAAVFGTLYLDASDSSVLADLAYRLDNKWRILTAASIQRFGAQSFQDFEFTIGRRFGAREVQLTYSTLNKRLSFDLTSTRF